MALLSKTKGPLMDLLSIISTLSEEIAKHEDGTDAVTPDVPTQGSMIADEVAFHIQEGLFNNDLPARLKLIRQITGYDVDAFIRRYPRTFSSALMTD